MQIAGLMAMMRKRMKMKERGYSLLFGTQADTYLMTHTHYYIFTHTIYNGNKITDYDQQTSSLHIIMRQRSPPYRDQFGFISSLAGLHGRDFHESLAKL